MIKAIAFDLDGTLIDFLQFKKDTARAAARAMVQMGLEVSEKQVYDDIFEVYDTFGMEYQKTLSKVLLKYGPRDLNEFEKIQHAGIIAYQKTKFATLHAYRDVLPTLKRLREKYKLAIVTDAPRNKAWQRLVITGLQDSFDLVVTVDDTGREKPSLMPFEKLIDELKLKPEEIMFVGDHPERDIEGAKAAGMKTVFVKYSAYGDKKSNADFEIEDVKELLDI